MITKSMGNIMALYPIITKNLLYSTVIKKKKKKKKKDKNKDTLKESIKKKRISTTLKILKLHRLYNMIRKIIP